MKINTQFPPFVDIFLSGNHTASPYIYKFNRTKLNDDRQYVNKTKVGKTTSQLINYTKNY